MILDDQLLVGLVLVAIGIVFALLTYAFVLSRRSSAAMGTAPQGDGPPSEPAAEQPHPDDLEAERPASEPAPPEPIAEQEPAPPPPPEPVVEERPAPPSTPPTPAEAPPQPEAESLGLKPVASVLRDELSGHLLIQVGDRAFKTLGELRSSDDWGKVARSVADLRAWLGSETPSEERPDEPAAAADAASLRKAPRTLVEEINEVLKEKLTESGSDHRAVRLVEGAGGEVKVYIGVESYALDEVPDPEVRRIIREAVEAWEARS